MGWHKLLTHLNMELPPGWRARLAVQPLSRQSQAGSGECIRIRCHHSGRDLVCDELVHRLRRPALLDEKDAAYRLHPYGAQAKGDLVQELECVIEDDPLPAYLASHLGLTCIRKPLFGVFDGPPPTYTGNVYVLNAPKNKDVTDCDIVPAETLIKQAAAVAFRAAERPALVFVPVVARVRDWRRAALTKRTSTTSQQTQTQVRRPCFCAG